MSRHATTVRAAIAAGTLLKSSGQRGQGALCT
jgi:hypothetical protein